MLLRKLSFGVALVCYLCSDAPNGISRDLVAMTSWLNFCPNLQHSLSQAVTPEHSSVVVLHANLPSQSLCLTECNPSQPSNQKTTESWQHKTATLAEDTRERRVLIELLKSWGSQTNNERTDHLWSQWKKSLIPSKLPTSLMFAWKTGTVIP